jgi:hypothetical protein
MHPILAVVLRQQFPQIVHPVVGRPALDLLPAMWESEIRLPGDEELIH